jgi:hypothetical protein
MLTQYAADGVIGDENTIENTILSYEPLRMLSIKATKPPAKFPFKNALTKMWTVMYFDSVDSSRTHVTVCSIGFGQDEESQKMREFFDRGNGYTLKKLQEKFAKPASEPATTASRTSDRPSQCQKTEKTKEE